MASGGPSREQAGARQSSSSSSSSSPSSDSPPGKDEDKDEGDVWLPWNDEYWNTVEEEPLEEAVHNKSGGFTTHHLNSTQEEELLAEANEELTLNLLSVVVLLAVLLLLTLLGNALVCLVYRTRFRRNTANLFVVFLAALETVVMVVGVPLELAALALPLTFRSSAACQLLRYVETASVGAVLLTLTTVAADRYCKLTRPTNFQMKKWAKALCAAAVVLALALAVPAFLLFSAVSVPTGVVGVQGMACGVEAEARSPSAAAVVYVSLAASTFLFALVAMTVLYVLMFVRILRRRSASRKEKVSPAKYPRTHRFVTEDSTSSCGGAEETRRLPTSSSGSGSSGLGAAAAAAGMGGAVGGTTPRSGRTSPGVDPAKVPLKSGVKESARIGQGASTTVDVQSTRMTFIFFLVSLTAVVAAGLSQVLRCLQVVTPLLDDLKPLAVYVVYQLCVRLYLLHPPLVPLIYLVCNHNFRREARHLLQKLGLSCKRQPSSSSSSSPPCSRNDKR